MVGVNSKRPRIPAAFYKPGGIGEDLKQALHENEDLGPPERTCEQGAKIQRSADHNKCCGSIFEHKLRISVGNVEIFLLNL